MEYRIGFWECHFLSLEKTLRLLRVQTTCSASKISYSSAKVWSLGQMGEQQQIQ